MGAWTGNLAPKMVPGVLWTEVKGSPSLEFFGVGAHLAGLTLVCGSGITPGSPQDSTQSAEDQMQANCGARPASTLLTVYHVSGPSLRFS